MGVADLRTPFYGVPKTDTSWLGKLVSTAGDAIDNKVAGDLIQKSLSQGQIQAGVAPGSPSVPTTTQQSTRAAPVMPVTRGEPQGSTYRPFIDTVQKGGRLPDGRQIPGITNPYGLSAVAAYGKAESSWSGDKANATWADPSESGQAGTSGGAMSWRGPRLGALQNYAKSKGEQGNGSPQTQAEFFLQENPQVTQALNNAKSPQEANSILANAWKFAGYDRPGGENGRRAAMTQNYYAQEFSKMPNAGAAAIEAVAPQGGFDSGRFAPTNDVAQGDLGLRRAMPELRPFGANERRDNADGSYSTEISTTWQLPDGSWSNVPSLWMGATGPQQFNPKDEQGIMSAMQRYEQATGQKFPRFSSEQEAVAAAKSRSLAGGAGAGQYVDPQVSTQPQAAPAPLPYSQEAPTNSPVPVSPQVTNNMIAAGITPATRQNVDPDTIRRMVQNPVTRQLGLALAQQVLGGGAKTSQEPWQFVKLPNGDFARANQQTGAIERVGNFAKQASNGEFGLSPIYGTDEQGNTVVGQVGKDGSFHRVDTGGFRPVGTTSNLNLGTSIQTRDKSGNVIGTTAIDNSGKAEATAAGKSLAESKQALPGVVGRAQTAIDSIDSLKNDPYLPNMIGPINSRKPTVFADGERVQSKIDQIKGQSFLGVYDELRGAGAITDIEGQKGTEARARLNTAQNVQDFNKALDDLKEVIQSGVKRAKAMAAGDLSAPAPSAAPGARKTSNGVTWSVEP